MAIEGGYGNAAQLNAMSNAAQQATAHIGKLVQQMAFIQASTGAVYFAARQFSQLELALTKTQAVAEGTAKEFKQMENAVRNYALATRFSAAESTQALYNLASAGFTIQQALKAMNATLDLAQATMTDVGMAADTLASTMAAFGLAANQAARVSNTFVASINKSQASIEKIAFAMRQVAPVAREMNNTLEETNAALAILFNQGLRGEQAGTALRNTMVRLANPTEKAREALYEMGVATQTTDGKVRKLKDVLADLAKVQNGAGVSTATMKTLVEDEALPGALGLIRSADRNVYLRKLEADKDFAQYAEQVMARTGKTARDAANELDLMERAISGTNAASETSAKVMLTLDGSFAQAKNAVGELAIELGQNMAPALRSIATVVSDVGIAFRGLSDEQKKLITALPLLAAGGYAAFKAFTALAGPLAAIAGTNKAAGTFAALGGIASAWGQGARNAMGTPYQGMNAYSRFDISPDPRQRNAQGRYMPQTFSDPRASFMLATGKLDIDQSKFAGSALGFLGRTVGLLTGIGGAAIMLYEIVGIMRSLKIFGGDRSAPGTATSFNIGDEFRRRGQSAVLTNADPYARDQELAELQKKLLEITADQAAQQKIALDNMKTQGGRIQDYSGAMGGRTNGINLQALANIMIDDSGKQLDLNNKSVAGFSRSRVADILGVSPFKITDEDLKQLQDMAVKWSAANNTVETINSNVKDVLTANKSLADARAAAQQMPKYQEEKLKASVSQQIADAEKASGFYFVSRTFIDAMNRDARAAQVALAKAQADLSADPIAQFIATTTEQRENSVRQALDQAEQAATQLRTQFGERLGGLVDIDKILSGLDFRSRTLMTGSDGKEYFKPEAHINKGIISMLQQGGYSKEEMLASFDEAINQAIADLKGAEPQLRQALEAFAAARRSTLSAMIDQQNLRSIQEMRTFRDNVEQRRALVVGLRDRLFGMQIDAIKEAVKQVGAADPFASARVEILEAVRSNNNAQTQLREIMNGFYKTFAPDGPDTASPQAKATADAFTKSYQESLRAGFSASIGNIIRAAKDAREKALDQSKVAMADIAATDAQLAQQLATFSNVSAGVWAKAVNYEVFQIESEFQTKMAANNERIRALNQTIAAARGLTGGMGLSPVPNLQVPADPATTAHRNAVEIKLQTIADTLKAIEMKGAAGPVGGLIGMGNFGNTPGGGSWIEKIIGVESGGNASAKNPGSSATGLGQFIESTWISMFKKYGASLGYGELAAQDLDKGSAARKQVADLRYDAELSRKMIELYGKETSRALDKNNLPITDTNMYLGHLLGQGGAVRLLQGMQKDPNAAVSNYVDASAISGNKGFFGDGSISAAEAYGRIMKKMGGDIQAVTAATTQLTSSQFAQNQQQIELTKWAQEHYQINDRIIKSEADLTAALKEKGATQTQITEALGLFKAKQEETIAAAEKEAAALKKVNESLELVKNARLAAAALPAAQVTREWNVENQILEEQWRLLGRGADVAAGVGYAFRKMRLEVMSDGQLAAQAMQSFVGGTADILAGLITGTEKDWRTAAANMLRSIAQVILKALIMRALTGLGNMMGLDKLFTIGSANGNVFAGGIVVPFQNGGLVHSMQKFQMANGGVASMSEVGTEAIVPLVRGPGGKLGIGMYKNGYQQNGASVENTTPVVRGGNGGGSATVAFSPQYNFDMSGQQQGAQPGSVDTDAMRQFQKDLDDMTQEAVMKTVQKHSRPGGMFHSSTQKYNGN